MPSQHGAQLWAQKEAKHIARRSVEIVKGVVPHTEKKAMSPSPPFVDQHPASEPMIPEDLQKGTKMFKISDGKKKAIECRIDADEGRIVYTSSKEVIVPIECIKELRVGSDTRYYRLQFKLPEEYEDRWITIIYTVESTYKTLHLITETRDVFQKWSAALQKLYTIRQGLMAGLGNLETRQAIWERQYWKGADEEGDEVLDFDDVERLCKRLNVNISPADLKKAFEDLDTAKRGYLDFSQFQIFANILKRRPEIEAIYAKLCTSNGGKLDLPAFRKFLKEYQKTKLTDSEIDAVFVKYASQMTSPNDDGTIMGLDKFSSFLMSNDNTPFSEQGMPIWQDMTAPISDYYISSSHNTYLVGHQLVGVSTIEGYIRALLHSCRSVELDIYDGDDEPTVYHGKTFTSKVALRDICNAIAKYSFVTSPYPVLISAEVHCSVSQQDKIVDIMTEVFGDSIVQAPLEGRPIIKQLPSPEELKHKFLLKAKNLYVTEQLAAAQAAKLTAKVAEEKTAAIAAETSSSESSNNEAETILKEGVADLKKTWKKLRGKDESNEEKPHKPKMSFRLTSLLVYTVGVKCHGLHPEIEYAPEHIFSLSENAVNRYLKASIQDLVKHNHTHLVRIYPKGTRVNSTNYQPHRYWAAGCQVTAINWQTFDLGYRINQAMFQRNGHCGYVLKPEALRFPESDLLSKRTQHFFDVTIISAQQLPRLRDSLGREIIDKSVVDPYVEVSLHIPDWSHSPFLPESATAAGAKYSPSTDATTTAVSSARTVSFKTPVVKNNGFNPVWQEELCLPFDCVGNMRELIFVEFVVRQEGQDEDDEPLGIYCIPLGCLEQGFRHLPLHDAQLAQHLFSTLFVHVNIRDVA